MVSDILKKRAVSIARFASYTLNMEAVRSYVISVDICQTVERYVLGKSNLQFVGFEVLTTVDMKYYYLLGYNVV
jgi:hypothetical protein